MYQVVITEPAIKELKKLDSVVKKKILKKLLILQNNPFHNTKKLSGSIIGDYRFRIGDYRAIFDISGNRVVIHKIGHRRDVYKFS